ncbi:hypothetical protein GGR52DRAFT_566056 [Hypoxylon sp. FL1284]|nr:hypothetical protein GGR52DRAFT_566056 [Hypoxylon sp. FL1284]
MVSRHIQGIGAGYHLVVNRLLPQRIPTLLPLSVLADSRRHFLDKGSIAACSASCRYNLVRRIHYSNANMSSTTASSATPPAESDGSTASPSASKEATTRDEGSEASVQSVKEEKKLPPLKGAEFRAYNRLAEHMDLFHAHFRTAWNALWAAACAGNGALGGKNKSRGRSIIGDGLAFVAQLEIHHNIEETYIFPILARRMPEFRNDGKDGKGAAELLRQHHEIHEGMEGMRKYLRSCREGEQDLDMPALKTQMESWGTILWTHLDQEVKTLDAENMRKYWTAEEIRQIPM